MNIVKLVVFDLDGTLVDSDKTVIRILNTIRKDLNLPFLYQKDIKNDDEILEIAIEVGADDVISDEISHEIITSLNEFNNVRDKLENLLGSPEQAEIIWQPENYIKVDDEKRATSILKLLDTLDNCEDVQGVYGNFDISEEIINKVNI